ncbi:MAG TPA: glycoside hydrolase family 2 TIM barrel-domain containing protein [Opitutaceae bacterium]|nr:glycoside hydrolase family 2 TIM barrel-domain containing protein [Opitutaceae bacterium]
MNQPLNHGWQFRRMDRPGVAGLTVELPHSPFIADLDGREHWFGECEYEREIQSPPLSDGARCVLYIGAAMHSCRASIGEREILRHSGGFLPFEIDLTPHLDATGRCQLRLVLDNRDNPDVPPGKAYEDLDFCWYAGLYRTAELRIYPGIHLTEAISAGEVAGGGVFLRTLSATEKQAVVSVRAHVRNASASSRSLRVRSVFRQGNQSVATTLSEPIALAPGKAAPAEMLVTLNDPALWSPATPALHEVTVSVLDDAGAVLDSTITRFGIRRIDFSRSRGFTVNGRRLRLRGTNRHQEMPRVGYAVPRAAHYRDARRIKEAGFDYVRLSHYPQAPEFLDACDELGVVVMNCIPGWQFLGGARFRDTVFSDARQMIRRDRNHACIVLWELSLNETEMDEELMARLHAIGHEEYPGDQMFTCGWIDRYDVFSHSRQHGEMHRWRNGDKALVIAEYGDWEYYARNEGFDQKTGAGVYELWSTARQFRGDGERGMQQQCFNHVVALNDTLASPAVFDGQWCMFDYARGYHPVRAACGIMDIFRLPKFSYHFYQSQRDPDEQGAGWTVGPMVFIASHWTPASALRVTIFSNADEVALYLNGRMVGRHPPAQTSFTQHLPHPPFFFDLPAFEPGRLEAIAFLGGQPVAIDVVATPGKFSKLEIFVDDLAVSAPLAEPDVVLVHARLCDAEGTLCIEEVSSVEFEVSDATVAGPKLVSAEAGIASIVVRVPANVASFAVSARAPANPQVVATHFAWNRVTPGAESRMNRPRLMPDETPEISKLAAAIAGQSVPPDPSR